MAVLGKGGGSADDDLVAAHGAQHLTRAFVENDGSVGYFVPSYSLYPVLADIRGVTRRPVALGSGFTWRAPADDGGVDL